ncbi:hypothetical protein HYH02_004401 [Chlamydomonas schloesseri]|uniref:GPR1/FUN34/yaaH family protein n=1 Tax=Chlamydomonas schloesseri TaxID=2026947 RepID=A0A836B9F0_9CHLO|nr:hypothetical protein HYH02_004401 [Chlamydomonas schloesseri]|eukprot:KAG2451134.1 hypothetical protein HYH02_004401 [Chlamydomonas schloesseri]
MTEMHKEVTVGLEAGAELHMPPMEKRPTRPIVSIPLNVAVRDEFVKGDPSFFGLLCFGMTTAMISFITTGWSRDEFMQVPKMYGLLYGGIAQLLVGLLELIKGDSFAGTTFASFGCFWMGWGLLRFMSEQLHAERQYSSSGYYHYYRPNYAATGEILWCSLWCVHSAGFLVVTARKNICMQVILLLTVIMFALQAAGVKDENCYKASGYFGFGAAAAAIYAAFAFLWKVELGWQLPGVAPTRYY